MKVRTIARAMPILLSLALFGQLVFSVTAKSPTLDEQNHVARGLAYLRTGDLRLSQEHPPGVNVWATWPLLLDPEIELPLDSASWANGEWYGFADKLLWQVNDRPQQMIFATRVPVMWLTLLLAALVYRWARTLGGQGAGLIAMTLLAFDPNILAHGRLTTTDLGVTAASLALMFALWNALRRDALGPWLVAGVALGIAQLSKFSALLLVPIVLLVVVLAWVGFAAKASTPGRWAWLGVRLLALLGVGCVVIWAGYAFTWGPIPALGSISGPAPAYWSGIQAILRRTGAGNPAFLMGQYSREGWWHYFPVAFAIKTPLPALILLLFGLGVWTRSIVRGARPWNKELARAGGDVAGASAIGSLCLILPVLSFWGVAIAGSFNVGYRHILPSLPFLYVFVGWRVGWLLTHEGDLGAQRSASPAKASTPGLWGRPVRLAIPLVLLLWLTGSTVAIAPHYLAFFNLLAGGPDGGYRFLVDSNLDWGQDLPGLARYVNQHGIDHVFLSWFGAAHPEAYDLPFYPLPGFWRFRDEPAAYGFNPYAPAAGMYAISASNLQGVALTDHDLYAWFRERAPVARIGHSILIYDVSPARASTPQGAVVLGVPMAQLADEERTLLRRGAAVRQYDPETGLIVPLTAEEVWYIAPEPPGWGRPIREGPGYMVVHSPLGPLHWGETGPRFGNFVVLLRHRVDDASTIQDGMVRVVIQWRVETPPHRAAVSFAHLLDRQGQYVAGWDGLAAPATCWQRSDLVQQEYSIVLPTELRPGKYQVEVGWYDAETGVRWPASAGGSPVGDRWLLPDVEVPG